jgi:hypothetical protein
MNLTLSEFVIFVLVGSATLVLLACLLSRAIQRRAERQSQRQRVVCRLCLHGFENRNGPHIIECPACGVRNETGR